jgi:hypothetical protein
MGAGGIFVVCWGLIIIGIIAVLKMYVESRNNSVYPYI